MNVDFKFHLKTTRFDEHYQPSQDTRLTTNFANLARGQMREENLRNTLRMIDNRFNSLAHWDNPTGDRYALELEIISVELDVITDRDSAPLSLIEILRTRIHDRRTGKVIQGTVGNNFSSYVRDYDFSVLLPEYNKGQTGFSAPENFGVLHGNIFRQFVESDTYREHFHSLPVICLSVSSSKVYHKTENYHPVLGVEYLQNELSPTDDYFAKMGMRVRYFMPPGSMAPFAFYFMGDLLADFSNLELISAISTMEAFQKIYRPEIYNANFRAGKIHRPSLKNEDYSLPRIVYDREERSRLAVEQGRFAEKYFIKPYRDQLERWSSSVAVNPLISRDHQA